ncbi:unnamed protein product [Brassica rapa subsp. trilocularis]
MLTQSSYKRSRFDLTCSIFVVVPWKKGDDISQWRFLFQQPSTQERCIGGYGFNGVCGGYDGGRAMDVVMKELMMTTKEVMIATEEEVVVEEPVEEHVAVVVTAVTVTSVTGVATVFTKQAVVVFQEETVIVDIEKFFVG